MTLKSDVKFEEKSICCFKNNKNFVNFDPSSQKSQKICIFIGPFCAKYITFEEKLTCGLEKDMRNLANFHQNT